MSEYELLQENLAQGWNTWNTRSVLSHVLLPEGFALNLGLREYVGRHNLHEALIGRRGPDEEHIHPGPHAYDGSYSELNLKWMGNELLVQSAREGDDLVLLVTPLAITAQAQHAPLLVVESGILWNRSGYLSLEDGALKGHFAGRTVWVYGTKTLTPDPHVWAQTPYLSMPLDGPVGVSTGKPRAVEEIQRIVAGRREAFLRHFVA